MEGSGSEECQPLTVWYGKWYYAERPFRSPPPYESLVGNLQGAVSRRINNLHRLVCQVLAKERTVKVLRMWTHYE